MDTSSDSTGQSRSFVETAAATTARDAIARRSLSRALSRICAAGVRESLDGLARFHGSRSRRIGITGPPGAGKSALISRLAAERLAHVRSLGVLAIDPTSPITGGSILGDRVRMGETSAHEGLFFRSIPSRASHDGLTDNIADLLSTMEQHGLEEIIVETVGVGQVEYTIRSVVDTVVLVVVPGAGDEVQAMKAGILEIADIFVVNKSDLPGARKMHAELAAMVAMRPSTPDSWQPPVLLASAEQGDLGRLPGAIDAHAHWAACASDPQTRARARMRHHLTSLLARRIEEVLDDCPEALFEFELARAYQVVLDLL